LSSRPWSRGTGLDQEGISCLMAICASKTLKDMGHTDALCLVSTDDEAFTYNKRVNRFATVQEHKVILKAVE
jgi:L-fucose mutarotase/ribose pyranase (RbsD/FucU family)